MTAVLGGQEAQKCSVCLITTEANFASVFLGPQIKHWASKHTVVVMGHGKYVPQSNEDFVHIPIERKPSIISDVLCLIIIIRQLRRLNPQVVITLMPKSGLLGQIAGIMCGIPQRVHIFTGQVWATKIGLRRSALIWLDKLIGRITTSMLTDSHSQKRVLINAGISPIKKVSVLGNGSICGVDTDRFCPDNVRRMDERRSLGLDDGDFVFLFLGRLCADKGVDAFLEMALKLQNVPNLLFVLAGHDEGCWCVEIEELQRKGVRVKYIGYRSDCENILRAVDVLVLPSAREGFGNVVIEAGASGIPVLTTDIYGLRDSVKDKVNGLKFALGDNDALVRLGLSLSRNITLCSQLGNNGRSRAVDLFDQKLIVREWSIYLDDLLQQR